MKKRWLALGLIISLGISLSGCGDYSPEESEIQAEESDFEVSFASPRPNTTITLYPSNPSYSQEAFFKYTCNKKRCEFKCQLDDGPWTKCGKAGKTYSNLLEGSHTFRVKAKNLATGLWDKTPAVYKWDLYITELSDSVIYIDQIPSVQLSDTTGGVYTYDYTGTPPTITSGDILLSGEGAGYLRKVTSVSDTGTSLIIETTQANLEEAFENLTIDFSRVLTPSDVQSQQALRKGVSLAAPIGTTFYIGIEDVVIYDHDENPQTKNDQIKLNGSISFEPEIHFSAKVKWFSLKYLYFTQSLTETAEVNLTSSVEILSLEKEVELAKYYFTPITITVGPVPVVLTPVLTVNVGVNGEISISITTGVTQTATLTGGLKYENSSWGLVSDFSNEFDFQPPTLQFECSAKAYAGADLNLMIYGVVGPYVEANGYLLLEADPFETPWWSLYAGLEVNGGVEIEVFSKTIAGYEANIIDFRKLLLSAPGDCEDLDHDHYYNREGCGTEVDCDDGEPTIYPGAVEICDDGIDQDCSGEDKPCTCGNGTCGQDENASNCPEDCPAICGDGFCTHNETVQTCPEDCPGPCGDGICSYGENNSNCPQDCPPQERAQQVSAGYPHTCALTVDGGVKCWGDNQRGQLGNGTYDSSYTPVAVNGLSSGVSAISAGGWHTCALTSGGAMKCWGRNDYGELGNGNNTDQNVPVDVSGLSSGVSAISAGFYHTCAIVSGGGLKCWGLNDWGQLGDGTFNDRNVPVNVSGLSSGVSAVSAGTEHTCAVVSGGVKCWGYNNYGQLGDGTNDPFQLTPVNVSGLSSGVIGISVAMYHSCAVLNNGTVKCWGRNDYGQLGDGTTNHSNVPVTVNNISSDATKVSIGRFYSCALVSGGVKCWGRNDQGQLGDGTRNNRNIPGDVFGLSSGVQLISAGDDHNCALTSAGTIKCWGDNTSGKLGDGSFQDRLTPVYVSGFAP